MHIVLCAAVRTACAEAWHLLLLAVDRVFRGHRDRARHRLAHGRFAGTAMLLRHSAVGIALDEDTPEHSTISRTRRLIDVEAHAVVFAWVLEILARCDSEYERRGTANIFCGVPPRAGRHFTKPAPNRSSAQFADYLVQIVANYPQSYTIYL